MASSNSSYNPNKIKIAGIGEDPQKGYLKNLNEKYGLSEHYNILERFKTFEDKIWGVPDTETTQTRAFIDKLLFIIHDEIRYPTLGRDDVVIETINANELVISLKELIKGVISSNNNKTIGQTMRDLKTKSKKPEIPELFDTFLCCLLMFEPKEIRLSEPPSKENKTLFFRGVFKSWGWLQQLNQVEDTKFEEFLIKIKGCLNRKQRTCQVTLGFQSIKYFINNEANKNLLMEKLDSTSQKEEAILEEFYNWIDIANIIKMKNIHFTSCYVNIKCEHLPKFDEYTNIRNLTNENFKKHLEWEIKSFDFLSLSRPTSTTDNVVSNLQVQLVGLWKQVKDIVNDRSVLENSNKGTLQRNLHEVPCSLDKLECLQINLNRSEEAWNRVVGKWLKDDRVHIVFIQEPCIKKMEITRQDVKETNKKDYCYYFPNLPTNYRAIHNAYLIDQKLANAGIFISAILVRKDVSFERILPMAAIQDKYNYPQELMAGIRLTEQGWMNGVTLFSIYCRPIRSLTMVLKPFLLGNHDMTRTVLCMDANATHPNWSPAHENQSFYSGRGEDLEYFRTSCNLKVANQNVKNVKKENNYPTKDDRENQTERKSTHVDVTFYRGDNLCIKDWERLDSLEDDTLSDHRYITFSIRNNSEDAKKSSLHLSSLKSCLGRNKVSLIGE